MERVSFVIGALIILSIFLFFALLRFAPAKPTTAPQSLISPSPSPSDSPADSRKRFCAQVITPARNPKTSECKEFPTPCDVPKGWEKVASCN